MKTEKDVGLEDVEILDFVDEKPEDEKDEKPKTEKKTEEKQLESVFSLPWKDVSHVLIGPSGVSLVPVGNTQKYSKFASDNTTYHPTPGLKPTVLEYDLSELFGSVNAAGELERELADARAELEKVKAELAELKKPKEEEPPKEDEKKPEDEMAKEVPEANGPRSEEERAMAHFKISKEDWDKLSDEEKKAMIAKLPERGSGSESDSEKDKSKEEVAKEEKKDASTKDEAAETTEKKTAEHEESNLATAMKLIKIAKEKNLL